MSANIYLKAHNEIYLVGDYYLESQINVLPKIVVKLCLHCEADIKINPEDTVELQYDKAREQLLVINIKDTINLQERHFEITLGSLLHLSKYSGGFYVYCIGINQLLSTVLIKYGYRTSIDINIKIKNYVQLPHESDFDFIRRLLNNNGINFIVLNDKIVNVIEACSSKYTLEDLKFITIEYERSTVVLKSLYDNQVTIGDHVVINSKEYMVDKCLHQRKGMQVIYTYHLQTTIERSSYINATDVFAKASITKEVLKAWQYQIKVEGVHNALAKVLQISESSYSNHISVEYVCGQEVIVLCKGEDHSLWIVGSIPKESLKLLTDSAEYNHLQKSDTQISTYAYSNNRYNLRASAGESCFSMLAGGGDMVINYKANRLIVKEISEYEKLTTSYNLNTKTYKIKVNNLIFNMDNIYSLNAINATNINCGKMKIKSSNISSTVKECKIDSGHISMKIAREAVIAGKKLTYKTNDISVFANSIILHMGGNSISISRSHDCTLSTMTLIIFIVSTISTSIMW